MKYVLLALLLVAFSAPAQAQSHPKTQEQPEGYGQSPHRPGASRKPDDREQKAAETEKAYNETIKHIPRQKPADPWGKMR